MIAAAARRNGADKLYTFDRRAAVKDGVVGDMVRVQPATVVRPIAIRLVSPRRLVGVCS